MKVALALGGGASRGLAHMGVIQALTEAKIPINIIAGVSIGGVIGAIYAAHPQIDRVIQNVNAFLDSQDFNQTKLELIQAGKSQSNGYYEQLKKMVTNGIFLAISSTRSSFISRETFERNLSHLVPKIGIEDCEIPLGLIGTDLKNGQAMEFLSGPMMEAVMATSAIPGIFPPVKIGGKRYVDGSWLVPVPVELARKMGADLVIAVDVAPTMSNLGDSTLELSGLDIQLRASEASRMALKGKCLSQAEVKIVVDLMDIHWADFTKLDLCVERGYSAARRSLEVIEKALFKKKVGRFFGFR
ncbi:MAG: hypothetical protein A2600_04510 [Candidatus Lambdaproteobacteria bacterium RIFOXYD1_FULL_56_27]|nr:MAG: hypothetical protein A2426_13575 [Candidatus Lambdaproteobacteria bacterium RIFOXYC1_FULL_56_13]OGH09481.1 MAG: hypothetical protein A2600_04510 [Candidatus Lambdaproteobacteria bacterium RIFOXYD1_FULL_56_27]